MRKFGLTLLLCSLSIIPAAALSQEAAPSADEYACAITGDCPAEPEQQVAAEPSGSPRVSATRSFSLSTSSTATPTPARTTPPPRRRTVAPATLRPTVATSERGRVNLRLAFAPGSTTLSSAAQTEVRAFAQALQRPQLASMRFRIEGHTDSSGSRAANISISQRRAQAVADYLISQGVAANRLEVRGYGFDRPLPGRSAAARENRRVEALRLS